MPEYNWKWLIITLTSHATEQLNAFAFEESIARCRTVVGSSFFGGGGGDVGGEELLFLKWSLIHLLVAQSQLKQTYVLRFPLEAGFTETLGICVTARERVFCFDSCIHVCFFIFQLR